MPLFDALGNTLNKKSWESQRKNSLNSGSLTHPLKKKTALITKKFPLNQALNILENADKNGRVPDFVFLAHIVDMSSAMHAPFLVRSMSSLPFYTRLYLIPLWPISFAVMLVMWAKSKAFLVSFYYLRNRLHQTWVVPRFGFQVRGTASKFWSETLNSRRCRASPNVLSDCCIVQYFLPFAAKGINKQIEDAILRADRLGVKVISLAALNKVYFYFPLFLHKIYSPKTMHHILLGQTKLYKIKQKEEK